MFSGNRLFVNRLFVSYWLMNIPNPRRRLRHRNGEYVRLMWCPFSFLAKLYAERHPSAAKAAFIFEPLRHD